MKKLLFWVGFLCITLTLHAQGILRDRNGQIMRGTPMVVGKQYQNTSVRFAKDVNNWRTMRDTYKLNTVRICWVDPWFKDNGQDHWNVFEAIFHIEQIVKNANATGMNVIINYHNTGEKIRKGKDLDKNQQIRIDFWRNIAKKYKDNNLVYFELSNEPVFDHRDYINPTFKNSLMQIYNIVRFEAPNRQIIMFSFNNMSDFMDDVVRNYSNQLDWSKTSVGYHAYHSFWHETTSIRIRDLAKTRRVICTEFDVTPRSYVKRFDGTELNSEALERIKHSWIDWRDWDDNTYRTLDILQNDAKRKGYFWAGSSNTGGAPIGRYISLRKSGGDRKYASAIRNGNRVVANASGVSWWEKFLVEAHPKGGIALKAQSDGKYLQVPNKDQNAPVRNSGNFKGDWERFTWKSKGNGKVALRSVHSGKWLQLSHNENNTNMRARGGSDRSWETFDFRIESAGGKALSAQNDTNTLIGTNESTAFSVYPVPASDQLFISGLSSDAPEFKVVDVTGKVISVPFTYSDREATLDVSNLASGVYVVRTNTHTTRFVKK